MRIWLSELWGRCACAWTTWDGWIGIKRDRWSKLVHSTTEPSVRAQPSMTVSLLKENTLSKNVKLRYIEGVQGKRPLSKKEN